MRKPADRYSGSREGSVISMIRSAAASGKTVLVVDDDVGFVFWLGCTLRSAGYPALPAKNWRDAGELVRSLHVDIRVLVMDYSIAGAREFAERLRRSQGHLKVVALVGDGGKPSDAPAGVDGIQSRHPCTGEGLEMKWLETIKGVLAPGRRHDRARGGFRRQSAVERAAALLP